MSTALPEVISETNLSYAWGRVLLSMLHRRDTLMPLMISIGGLTNGIPREDTIVRKALDTALCQHGKFSCATSAMTIFPFRYWEQTNRPHIEQFADSYLQKYLPRLRARSEQNRSGTYFERMVDFHGTTRKGARDNKNQLQHVISLWQKGGGRRPRRSALQLAIFDPLKDHNASPRSMFPCLQQIGFVYNKSNELAVNAYYPAQYIFDRAYGNYLGLCHLGLFVAHEIGIEFVRLNCFIGRPELRGIPRKALQELVRVIEERLAVQKERLDSG